VESDALRHGTYSADYLRRERISRPDRLQNRTIVPLNPVVGWSIALLLSLSLWWGIWLAVSALASATAPALCSAISGGLSQTLVYGRADHFQRPV
jgi:hypothetical protein